jgi:hypothetical protein
MKGIVFREFIDMVEEVFDPDMADQIIDDCQLESEGAYTTVGTYDHAEILQMVTRLSEITKTSVPGLVQSFGKHMLARFTQLYPEFFAGINTTYDFLDTIENHIHVEVKKLYSDAELPSFQTQQLDPQNYEMIYQSSRPFADLAHGLILGTIEHFQENITIDIIDLSNGQGNHCKFLLKKL